MQPTQPRGRSSAWMPQPESARWLRQGEPAALSTGKSADSPHGSNACSAYLLEYSAQKSIGGSLPVRLAKGWGSVARACWVRRWKSRPRAREARRLKRKVYSSR